MDCAFSVKSPNAFPWIRKIFFYNSMEQLLNVETGFFQIKGSKKEIACVQDGGHSAFYNSVSEEVYHSFSVLL
jgi:hypothetical protein